LGFTSILTFPTSFGSDLITRSFTKANKGMIVRVNIVRTLFAVASVVRDVAPLASDKVMLHHRTPTIVCDKNTL
jgi:hypothetical protein